MRPKISGPFVPPGVFSKSKGFTVILFDRWIALQVQDTNSAGIALSSHCSTITPKVMRNKALGHFLIAWAAGAVFTFCSDSIGGPATADAGANDDGVEGVLLFCFGIDIQGVAGHGFLF